MAKSQQTADLHSYFTNLYPDEPQLAADAAAANRMLGWAPPPDHPSHPKAEAAASLDARPAARRKLIDWSAAARLLAGGSSIEDAARQLCCDPQAIRRNLRRSRRFRLRIEGEHEHRRLMAQLRFGALGDYAISHMKLHPDNPRLLQWLGDRIGLGDLASGKAAGAGLAFRIQSALHPGQRIPDAEQQARREIDEKELKRMIDETNEWYAAQDAHDRMLAEKAAFEKAQREEESRQSGESDED